MSAPLSHDSGLPFHPLADISPMLDPKGLSSSADDIAENGLARADRPHEGKILDGRNRYKACTMAGVEPTSKTPAAPILSPSLSPQTCTAAICPMTSAPWSRLRSRPSSAATISIPQLREPLGRGRRAGQRE